MSKYGITFYCISWTVNTMTFGKFIQKMWPKNYSQVLNVYRFLSETSWKMKFLKKANYSGYVMAKPSNCVKISMQTSSDFFTPRIL